MRVLTMKMNDRKITGEEIRGRRKRVGSEQQRKKKEVRGEGKT